MIGESRPKNSNSKIYFGKDIPNMFMDSAGGVGKQFEGLADKLSFVLAVTQARSPPAPLPSDAQKGLPRPPCSLYLPPPQTQGR